MAVVFSFIFGRFVLVFTAFCLYVAVPLVRFSTFFSLFLAVLSLVPVFFWGGLGGVWGVVGGWLGVCVITSCRLRST